MLIEGLDAIIPSDGNGSWGSPSLSEAERRQWEPYNILRASGYARRFGGSR
jgi:hypothetical protein